MQAAQSLDQVLRFIASWEWVPNPAVREGYAEGDGQDGVLLLYDVLPLGFVKARSVPERSQAHVNVARSKLELADSLVRSLRRLRVALSRLRQRHPVPVEHDAPFSSESQADVHPAPNVYFVLVQ